MHGSSAGTPVVQTDFGGLVTLASPDSLPPGASPRCYDNDFLVGSTGTRPGLTGVYSYSGASLGPVPGGSAVDFPLAGAVWANAANVLGDDGNYAIASLPMTATANISTIAAAEVIGLIGGVAITVVFTGPLPLFSAGQVYTFSGITGYTQLNGQSIITVSVSGNTATFSVGHRFPIDWVIQPATPDTGSATIVGGSITDALDITQFGLSVPSTSTPLGFSIAIKGYSSADASLSVQMLKMGSAVGASVSKSMTVGSIDTVVYGGGNDLFSADWDFSDLNNTSFGIRIIGSSPGTSSLSIGYVTLTVYLAPDQTNFQFITTFTDQDGEVKNISLDASGNLWVENVTLSPGTLSLAWEDIEPNSHCVAAEGEGVEYLAFNDGMQGSYIPLQYTSGWIDRITQVGPGASPAFTPQVATTDTFAISTITQPAQKSDPADPGHFQSLLWSSGPGSATAGNVITVYYALKTGTTGGQDADLTAAFNSGNPVYVYVSTAPFGNGTYQVTSIGSALPPHGAAGVRWYFTYQVTTSNYQFFGGPDDATGLYQRTLATMTMSVSVPGLAVGSQILIVGASVANYNSTWTITQALDSGQMAIISTSVTGGVATYGYSLSSGVAPSIGHLVTVTGTTNGNGMLNVVNGLISAASGGSTGTFNINLGLPDAVSAVEQGQATTAGTIFAFDPGFQTLGTMTSPIYANSAGGTLTFGGNGQFIGTGTRQAVCFFITRNGYYTAPSPPVTFTCPANVTGLAVANIPIGPPNVVARGIAFTEAGQNGVPGAYFKYLPTEVVNIVNNVSYTSDAMVIQDNVTTSATFSFSDFALQNGRAIDVYGFDLFNQIELGNPGWIVNYDSRNFYGLCQNKIQNFVNLSFDGGYLLGHPVPLGWTQPDAYGTLINSPVFGNSYYIKNTSGSLLPVAGLISQPAFQDAYKQPILDPNTTYSIRVTARIPSDIAVGTLVVTLSSGDHNYAAFALSFSSMTSVMTTYTGVLLTEEFETVPENLLLNVSAESMGAGADVEIDRIELFPTEIPILGTTVFGSYSGLPEQVDAVSGQGKFISENQQPVNGGLVMYDTFYGLKGQGPYASMYSWQASPNLEPAQWDEPEVAQRAGACGPLSFDFGEQWLVTACRNGLYLYEGGQPGKIMQEIFQVWDAINWEAASSIWVRNDVTNRRLYVGVPLPTPNFWLPNAGRNELNLTVTHITVSPFHVPPHPPDAHISLTFVETPPAIQPGQSYTLSGLTSQTQFNGMTLYPQSISGNTVTFLIPGLFFAVDTDETGNAAVAPVPLTSPNVILMLNYQNLDSGREIQSMGGVKQSMFGALNVVDVGRKWSIWQIPSPYGATVRTATDKGFYICNGVNNSKVYLLDPDSESDDGVPIDTLYTTAGLGNAGNMKDAPDLGAFNKRTGYMSMTANGSGKLNVTFLPNQLIGPADGTVTGYNSWAVPGGFSLRPVCLWDLKAAVNFFGARTFVELRGPDFTISNLTLHMKKDPWGAVWGPK